MRALTFPIRWYRVWQQDGFRGWLNHVFTLPRKFVPTKAGWIFFGFMLAIIVFAYSTANNLLFLLFSAMMTMMVLSGILSEASLGKIRLARRFPEDIFAKRPFRLTYDIHNRARLLGAYAFFISDPLLPPGAPGPMAAHLPAAKSMQLKTQATFPSRGRFTAPPMRLITRYPFLLFVKSRVMNERQEVLVYPAIHPVALSIDDLFAGGDRHKRDRHEDGDSFSYLREYEKGEPLRKVDWKKSASKDDIFVKEFTQPESKRVLVRLVFEPKTDRDYEAGLSTAASLLLWLEAHGVPFALADGASAPVTFASDFGHLRRALTRLALYSAPQSVPAAASADKTLEVNADGSFKVR